MSGKEFTLALVIRTEGGKVASAEFKQLGAEGKAAGEKIAEGARTGAQASAALATHINTAAKSQDQYAISAKQMQAAMRGVPAQFTDIFTSISAGQNPMQVLLQQGGQLKDMFGGVGPAARALGGYVAGLVTPMTVAASAIVGVAVAAEMGRRESEEMARAVILTGNAAGTTTGQMQAYARTVAEATGATRGAAADAITQLTATGKVSSEMLGRTAEAAVRLQRAGGPAIADTVARFAELGKAPVEASIKLNEQTNYLTAAVYRQIKATQEQGDIYTAAALAQKASADADNERAAELEKNLGALERAWRGVGAAAGWAWDKMKNIGREDLAGDLSAATARANDLRDRIAVLERSGTGSTVWADIQRQRLAGAEAEEAALRKQVTTEKERAEAKAKSNQREAAGIGLSKEADKYITRQAQMKRELAKVEDMYAKAVAGAVSEEDKAAAAKNRRDASAGIRDKFKDTKSGKTALQKMLELGQKNELDAYYETGGEETMRIVAEKRAVASALKEIAEADREAAKAEKEWSDAVKRAQQDMERRLDGLDAQATKAELEVVNYGLSAAAIEQNTIARLEERRAIDAGIDGLEDSVAALDREIETRKRLVAASRSKEALDANKKATDEMQRDWERMHEQLSQSLTDQLMKGGQSAGELLENYFKTLVLRPVIQGAVSIGMNAVGSALGFSGAANASGAAGGGSNLFSLGSAANNLLGGATAAYNTGAYMTLGSMGMEQAAMLAAQDAVFGAAGTAATLEAAGASAFASTLGAALPWVGGAIAVGSMLGLFDGGGDDPHNNPQASGFHLALSKAGASGAAGLDSPSSFVAGPTSGAGWWGENTALSGAQLAALNKQTAAAFAQGHALALSLGVDPSLADKARVDSTVHGTPGNGAIVGYFASIDQAFGALADSIAKQVVPNIDEFQQSGESLAQTASRLSQEFALTNRMATLMGRDAATAFGGTDLKVRDALIQSLGGLGGATSTFDSYYRNYHSEAERRTDTQGSIAATLRAIGIADVPATRDQYRALVEGQDLATESGRTMYATLLSVADAFAGITDSAEAAAAAMGTDRFRSRADYRFAQRTGVLPAYADGGDHDGGWAMVGEVGPEVAYMPPSRIYSNRDSKALVDMSQVTQAIDGLRADLRAVNASLARAANRTAKTLDKWDGDGMPLTRVT
jgi:hypothetical protein